MNLVWNNISFPTMDVPWSSPVSNFSSPLLSFKSSEICMTRRDFLCEVIFKKHKIEYLANKKILHVDILNFGTQLERHFSSTLFKQTYCFWFRFRLQIRMTNLFLKIWIMLLHFLKIQLRTWFCKILLMKLNRKVEQPKNFSFR